MSRRRRRSGGKDETDPRDPRDKLVEAVTRAAPTDLDVAVDAAQKNAEEKEEEEESMLRDFDASDKVLFRETLLVLESGGERGEISVAGARWPRIPAERLQSKEDVGVFLAMVTVANAFHKKLIREGLPWRVKEFTNELPEGPTGKPSERKGGKRTIYMHVDLAGGGTFVTNLRNRAYDLLCKGDREEGVLDPVMGSGDTEAFVKKVELTVAGILAFCDAIDRAHKIAKERREPVDEQSMARLVAEAAKRWGAKDLAFRIATGAKGESNEEMLKRVERKEWVSEAEFRNG